MKTLKEKLSEAKFKCRFYGNIARDASGCWIWKGAKDSNGYGHINFGRRLRHQRTHRISYLMHVGSPGRLLVLHKCDVRACVNPDHLYLGDHRDNTIDSIKRKKFVYLRGQDNGHSVLSDKSAAFIKSHYKPRHARFSGAALAVKFDVARSTIYAIANNQNWRHL